ncbi:uncharacterized protein LOC133194700 [Saccostrea echinata]|uniref:uncharacterized protein LOC133194700 n=1 Tax=Saccostrea echinata TaxID=191078 RepID=UPI002A82021E|nr:uncharacterized protein LOC133194700 [Saccostrea echinata]
MAIISCLISENDANDIYTFKKGDDSIFYYKYYYYAEEAAKSKMSTGQIVGLVLGIIGGSLVFVFICVCCIVWCVRSSEPRGAVPGRMSNFNLSPQTRMRERMIGAPSRIGELRIVRIFGIHVQRPEESTATANTTTPPDYSEVMNNQPPSYDEATSDGLVNPGFGLSNPSSSSHFQDTRTIGSNA